MFIALATQDTRNALNNSDPHSLLAEGSRRSFLFPRSHPRSRAAAPFPLLPLAAELPPHSLCSPSQQSCRPIPVAPPRGGSCRRLRGSPIGAGTSRTPRATVQRSACAGSCLAGTEGLSSAVKRSGAKRLPQKNVSSYTIGCARFRVANQRVHHDHPLLQFDCPNRSEPTESFAGKHRPIPNRIEQIRTNPNKIERKIARFPVQSAKSAWSSEHFPLPGVSERHLASERQPDQMRGGLGKVRNAGRARRKCEHALAPYLTYCAHCDTLEERVVRWHARKRDN